MLYRTPGRDTPEDHTKEETFATPVTAANTSIPSKVLVVTKKMIQAFAPIVLQAVPSLFLKRNKVLLRIADVKPFSNITIKGNKDG
mmetsp:Transcript_10109/g.12465  ORF Transcript_10109/g.12465 Transcript_10109/m.12465 type:complete len:86 (-) Transcript_10109:23-280(-)